MNFDLENHANFSIQFPTHLKKEKSALSICQKKEYPLEKKIKLFKSPNPTKINYKNGLKFHSQFCVSMCNGGVQMPGYFTQSQTGLNDIGLVRISQVKWQFSNFLLPGTFQF